MHSRNMDRNVKKTVITEGENLASIEEWFYKENYQYNNYRRMLYNQSREYYSKFISRLGLHVTIIT